ncbi:hypothetical protein [Anabaena sp. CCY 0017]|uniref:hypothetical protein n=1 Tax=Anabaena sp. CCY 0017 TaxID=3103866 RepID=UPI0039C730B7
MPESVITQGDEGKEAGEQRAGGNFNEAFLPLPSSLGALGVLGGSLKKIDFHL